MLRIFVDLCLLRAAPQDLPAARTLLGVTLAAYALVSLMLAAAQLSLSRALLYALLDTLVLALLTHTLLILRRAPARLPQTLSALAGTGAILGVIAWPLTTLDEPSWLLFILLIWSLAVSANILRHALSVSLGVALLASLGYLLMGFAVTGALLPQGL